MILERCSVIARETHLVGVHAVGHIARPGFQVRDLPIAINLGAVYKITAGGSETILHSFSGGATDGQDPLTGLVRDQGGNLYGTTGLGGNVNCPDSAPLGCGVVFKLDQTGRETLLHTFNGYPNDGSGPRGIVLDSNGNLYGAAGAGGNDTDCQDNNSSSAAG